MLNKNLIAGVVLAMAGVSFIFVGCTRTVYVPVQKSSVDTLYNTRLHADTVFERDSIFIGLRGDTVIHEVFRWKNRVKVRVDTVYKSRNDTVRLSVVDTAGQGIVKPAKKKSVFERIINLMVWLSRLVFLFVLIWLAGKVVRLFQDRSAQ